MKKTIKLLIVCFFSAIIGFIVGFGLIYWDDQNITKDVLVYQTFEDVSDKSGGETERDFYWSEITNKKFDQEIRGIPPEGFVRPYPYFRAAIYDYFGDEYWNKPKLTMRGVYENTKDALLQDFKTGTILFRKRLKDKGITVSFLGTPTIIYTPIRDLAYYVDRSIVCSVLPAVIAGLLVFVLFSRVKANTLVLSTEVKRSIQLSKVLGLTLFLITVSILILFIGFSLSEELNDYNLFATIFFFIPLPVLVLSVLLTMRFNFARIALSIIFFIFIAGTIPVGLYNFFQTYQVNERFLIAAFSLFLIVSSFLVLSLLFNEQLKSEMKKSMK